MSDGSSISYISVEEAAQAQDNSKISNATPTVLGIYHSLTNKEA
jgi:hypothetical protein